MAHPLHTRTRRLPSLLAFAVAAAGGCASGDDEASGSLSFVGRETCASCHPEQVAAFSGSHHDLAMDSATEATVLADFDGVALNRDGVETRFERRDGRYMVTTADLDGEVREFEVTHVFGVDPLQQYLVPLADGRVQRLGWSWDARPAAVGGQRWFHVYGDEPTPPGSLLHWARSSQSWNRMCADCHSTNLDRGYDAGADAYTTTWSELDVSCEACHGPASGHLAWAQRHDADPRAGFASDVGLDRGVWTHAAGAPTASRDPARRDRSDLDTCAACHSHRVQVADVEAGAAFDQTWRISLPRPPLYHLDGQVREEVFVLGSFQQSRMYEAGVGCGDCHDPHTAQLRAEGNSLCAQCHQPSVFDTPAHHRHVSDGDGGECVSCHMPETTFMQVDARRDHGFSTPRVTDSTAPNACLSCHEDGGPEWVDTTLTAWYGPPTDSTRLDRVRAFAAAERTDPDGLPLLLDVATDSKQPDLVRAAAVSYLDRYPSERTLTALDALLRDAHPRVRAEAIAAMRMLRPEDRIARVAPHLSDTSRLVRLAAARTLAPVHAATLPETLRAPSAAATGELDQALALSADDPAARTLSGDVFAERGALTDAVAAYRAALEIEPLHAPAWINLADVYRAAGLEVEAAAVLAEARAAVPDEPLVAYAAGLSEVRDGRLESAVELLREAAERSPAEEDFTLALVLALVELGRSDEARQLAQSFLQRHPDSPGVQAVSTDLGRQP